MGREDEIGTINMMTEQSQLEVLLKKSKQIEQNEVAAKQAIKEDIKLSFSDSREDAIGLVDINAVLSSVGVESEHWRVARKGKINS